MKNSKKFKISNELKNWRDVLKYFKTFFQILFSNRMNDR